MAAFQPAQVAAWTASKPWDAPRAILEAQEVPGVRVGRARGTEAASFEGGMIVLKDEWFTYPTEARRAIMYHEAGHGLEEAAGADGCARAFGVDNALDILDLPGASRFGHNYSEVIATAYQVAWDEPGWASFEGGRETLAATMRLAREHGYPVPLHTASKVASSAGPIYRGVKVTLPAALRAEVDALLRPPTDASQIDQERRVGALVVSWLQDAHWDDGVGLGRHWTTKKDFAQAAALQGGRGDLGVVLTATYDPADADPDHHGGNPATVRSEGEVTLFPGSPVTITNVEFPWWRESKGLTLIDQPIRATASMKPPIDGFEPPATTSCNRRSDAYVRWLGRRGVQGQVVTFLGRGKADHAAVVVGDWVVDWTYRQFDPSAPEPLVEPLVTYADRWDEWGTDYYAGMIFNPWHRTAAKVRRITDLSPSEFASKRWVYHGTRDLGDLRTLLTQGVRRANVPMNLNRRRYQSGDIEGIFFQPGAGVGMGLYVGDFAQAQQFGDCVVAIEVQDGDLGLPPESADYADYFEDPIGKALKDANGAIILNDIPASRVYLVAERFARYERDPMEMARANAEGLNKKAARPPEGAYTEKHGYITYAYTTDDDSGVVVSVTPNAGSVSAYDGSLEVGRLWWSPRYEGSTTKYVIDLVRVHEAYRGEGIATKMLEIARARFPHPIEHSTTLTEDGAAWSQKVGAGGNGGDVPASTSIRRNRVGNIDTDRLSRRREFLRSLLKDQTHALENRIDFVWKAAELHAIENELERRGELPDERITLRSKEAWKPGDVEGWITEVIDKQYPDRGRGACRIVSEVVRDEVGYPNVNGIYWSGDSLEAAIEAGTVYDHWWNVTPSGDIFDGTGGQFHPSGDTLRKVPRGSREHGRYIAYDDLYDSYPFATAEAAEEVAQYARPRFGVTAGVTYEVVEDLPAPAPMGSAEVRAYVGGTMVGKALLNSQFWPSGSYRAWSVWNIFVEPEHQRKGIARGMMEALHAKHPADKILHQGFASEEGAAFAESLPPSWNRVKGWGDSDYRRPRSAALKVEPERFWRVHPAGRGWDNPTSTQFHPQPGEGTREGFSCFSDPWVLWAYVMLTWRGMVGPTDRVVGFEGRRVGTGHDGEDLAIPTTSGYLSYTWDDFCDELLTTPLPASPAPVKANWAALVGPWRAFDAHRTIKHVIEHTTPQGRVVRAAALKYASPPNWKHTPGDRQYLTSFVGKNGRTYFLRGNYDSVTAFTEDPFEHVGKLTSWDWNGRREIYKIAVNERHRRQGVATAMLALAREFHPDLVHAQPIALSPDGRAWSERVGVRASRIGQPGYLGREDFEALWAKVVEAIRNAPAPTADQVKRNLDAMKNSGRNGGDFRGNSYDRRRRTQRLLDHFGDGTHVGCAYCGKILDADTLSADKIITGRDGGRYVFANLLPSCQDCNARRGDARIAVPAADRMAATAMATPPDVRIMDPECIGWSGGQTDLVVYAFANDRVVGNLHYAVYQGEIHVAGIEVLAEYRRQGIASEMWAKMLAAHPHMKVNPGYFTDDGKAWWASHFGKVAGTKVRAWRGVSLDLDYDQMTEVLTAIRDNDTSALRRLVLDRPMGEWWSREEDEPRIYAGEFTIYMNGDGQVPVVFEADIDQADRDPAVEATGYEEWQKPVCPRPGSTVDLKAIWVRIPDPAKALDGVASAMETLEQPALGRGEWRRIPMGITATAIEVEITTPSGRTARRSDTKRSWTQDSYALEQLQLRDSEPISKAEAQRLAERIFASEGIGWKPVIFLGGGREAANQASASWYWDSKVVGGVVIDDYKPIISFGSPAMLHPQVIVHEAAHLVNQWRHDRDTDIPRSDGHGPNWRAIYGDLAQTFLGESPWAHAGWAGLSMAAAKDPSIEVTSKPFNDPFLRGGAGSENIRLSDDGIIYIATILGSADGRRWRAGTMRLRRRLEDDVWEVWRIAVDEDFRRKGVATAMIEQARADLGRVDHAPMAERTYDGRDWSAKVGALDYDGFTPPPTPSCNRRSSAFVAWLGRRGVKGEVVSFVGKGKADHAAVVVDGTVVDWTYRQFDPQAPEPLIEPLEVYSKRWDDWGTDYYGGMILNPWPRTTAKGYIPIQREGGSTTLKPLPMGPGIFYRLQGERPFDPTNATSTPLVSHDDAVGMFGKEHADRYFTTKPGYSAFPNPEHVRQYVEDMDWDKGKVVAFRGTIVGVGLDDEPLVQPQGGPIETIEWDDFEGRIEVTPDATHYPRWDSAEDGGGWDFEVPGQGPRWFTLGVRMGAVKREAAIALPPLHDTLYPAVFDGLKVRPEVKARLLQVVNGAMPEGTKGQVRLWLEGSGASFNWDEAGDLDIQVWVALATPVGTTRAVREVLAPLHGKPLSDIGVPGAMQMQFYVHAGDGTPEDALKAKPYALYDLDTDTWAVMPIPQTPAMYAERFARAQGPASIYADQADDALGRLDRAEQSIEFAKATGLDYAGYADEAAIARQQAMDLYARIKDGRAQAYGPGGEGLNDVRDTIVKVLEAWGVWQRLKALAEAEPVLVG